MCRRWRKVDDAPDAVARREADLIEPASAERSSNRDGKRLQWTAYSAPLRLQNSLLPNPNAIERCGSLFSPYRGQDGALIRGKCGARDFRERNGGVGLNGLDIHTHRSAFCPGEENTIATMAHVEL